MAETGKGGMPRVSEMIVWDEERAKKPTARWGCWDCGFEDSYVRDVDKDTEHIRVRRRQCTRCGSMWETEERRIARGSFFGRAEKRRYASFRKKRYSSRSCLVCRERYMSGQYKEHTESSDAHKARVAVKQRRIKDRERRYRRMHARASREIKRATAGMATCKRCGEHYPLNVRNPYKTHAGSSPEHRWVVQQEARERRDRRRQAAKRGNHAKRQ